MCTRVYTALHGESYFSLLLVEVFNCTLQLKAMFNKFDNLFINIYCNNQALKHDCNTLKYINQNIFPTTETHSMNVVSGERFA